MGNLFVCVCVCELAERRAQLVRSRSRQNVLQEDSEVIRPIEFDSESQSPTYSSDPGKQRMRRTPGERDRHPGKISASALDSLMAST